MEYLDEAGELFLDSGLVSFGESHSDDGEEEEESEKIDGIETSLSKWSSWFSSLVREEKKAETKKENFNRSSILARKVTKELRNGDLFSGLVDAVTGGLVYGRRVYVSSGEVYEGGFLNEKRHGRGCVWMNPEGCKFIGRYCYDSPVEGTYITPDLTYTGQLSRSSNNARPEFHGDNGTVVHRNGEIYKGDFRCGLYHGCGSESTAKFRYKGEYSQGKRHGMGSLVVPVVLEDERELDYCSKDGLGTVSLPPLVGAKCLYKYSGMWKGGMKEGRGTEELILNQEEHGLYYSSTFHGMFHQNRRNGPGMLTLFDGTVIEGIWRYGRPDIKKNNRYSPHWRLLFPNRNIYHGECSTHLTTTNNPSHPSNSNFLFHSLWNHFISSQPPSNLLPHGHGTMFYYQSGNLYAGNFKMGKRNGQGMCIYQSSGDQYDGLWHDDEPHENVPNLYLYQPLLSPKHSSCPKTSSKTSFVPTSTAASLTFDQDDDSSTQENITNLPSSSLLQTLALLHTSTIKKHNKSTTNLCSSKPLISLWQAEKIEAYIQTARQAISDFGYDLTSPSSSSHAMTTTSSYSSSSLENDPSTSSTSSKEGVVEVLYDDIYNTPSPQMLDHLPSSKHDDICNVRGIVNTQSQCGTKAVFTVFTRLEDG